MDLFSADEIANMHRTALRMLKELGIKVLLPEAVALFKAGGARVEGEMVYLGEDMITAALALAPKSIEGRACARDRDILL